MKVEILGVKIDNITMEQAVNKVSSFFDGKTHTVFTPNPEIIMLAQKDEELMNALNSADILLPDGIGVVIGSKLIGKPLPERVAGYDFACNLLNTDRTFYLLGAKPGVAEMAAEKLKMQGAKIVGTHDGYFKDDTEIINDINNKKPDILLVCLGAPKQEKWIYENKDKLNVALCLGVGGTLDVIAGTAKRAPMIYQKLYIEWLYRAVKEPYRIPRLMALPQFIIKVAFGGRK